MIRRVVDTTRGPVLLEISNWVRTVAASATPLSERGWELRDRQLTWQRPPLRVEPDYRERGGRDSLAEALEEAMGIPSSEAKLLADETLSEWTSHLRPEDTMNSRTATRAVLAMGAGLVLLVGGFLALLAIVLVKLVF